VSICFDLFWRIKSRFEPGYDGHEVTGRTGGKAACSGAE